MFLKNGLDLQHPRTKSTSFSDQRCFSQTTQLMSTKIRPEKNFSKKVVGSPWIQPMLFIMLKFRYIIVFIAELNTTEMKTCYSENLFSGNLFTNLFNTTSIAETRNLRKVVVAGS
jgi:hypothetical protein